MHLFKKKEVIQPIKEVKEEPVKEELETPMVEEPKVEVQPPVIEQKEEEESKKKIKKLKVVGKVK